MFVVLILVVAVVVNVRVDDDDEDVLLELDFVRVVEDVDELVVEDCDEVVDDPISVGVLARFA
ncbi:MAG: hypothetical protein M1503_03340 [Thaumarchaeota archaeon]|nr:hypothetical protein [Nitrososphaerota archaeon]